MRKLIVPLLTLVLFMAAAVCDAQYYGYYYPNYGPYPQPQNARPVPQNPYQYRVGPSPRQYRDWVFNNYYQDYQRTLRSPYNPESTLDHVWRMF
jgi:hypothetical protein